MKLGYIDYLNCYPFYYHMMEKAPLAGIKLFGGYPTDLNRMMASGELDMSPISSAAYPEMADEVVLLPDFCLSSVGYVQSVILISKVPVEQLDGRRVGLSAASRTSVVLLKVILAHYYGVKPVYLPVRPLPALDVDRLDAALIIGNEAMQASAEAADYRYDLGELWLDKTGFPVVFAVFAVRIASIDKYPRQLAAVLNSYAKSLASLDDEREVLIKKAQAKYAAVQCDVDEYYRFLQYTLSANLRQGLEFYLDLAGKLGFLDKFGGLNFLPDVKK
jgi:chorismate dehydratase